MNDRPPERQVAVHEAGLCAGCAHVQVVTSDRGAAFYLCRLSFADPRFRRYPPIPVLACAGFRPPPLPAPDTD